MLFPKIITISGVDGSGKTTVSNSLKKYLEKEGNKVSICHSGALLKSSSESKLKISYFIGIMIFIKDYLQILFQYISRLNRYNYVIFDRFIYDTIVKISYKQKLSYIPPLYSFLVKFLFPLRITSFLLLTPPSISWNRDKEHLKEYHKYKFALYQTLPKFFPLKVINSKKSVQVTTKQAKNYLQH